MLTIFHAPHTRSLRVLWLCEEMGIPYRTEPASLQDPSPAFLKANPLRTSPAMMDGGTVLTESIAIMLYIMSTKGPTALALTPGDAGYADYLQFLILGESGLAMNASPIVTAHFQAPEAEKLNWSVRNCMERLITRLESVDAALADGRSYIAGQRFTAADISIGWLLNNAAFIGVGDKVSARTARYVQTLTARPAFQRAFAKT